METILSTYGPAITTFGGIGGLLLVQLLIADIAGIVSGHKPGTAVADDHSNFLFRAVRAHANTNESVAVFITLVAFGIAISADPEWINRLSVVYLVGRLGHMLSYYVDLGVVRSLFFAVSLVALLGLAIVGWGEWLLG